MIIISKKFRKLWVFLSIMLFTSGFFYLFNTASNMYVDFADGSDLSENHEHNTDFELEISAPPSLSTYSGVGKAQNVTEYGEGYFLNNNLNISNNENASIIIPNDWEGREINCNVTNIYEYGAIIMNQTFDNGIDQNRWTNYSDNPSNFTVGHYNNPTGSNDSIYLKLDEDGGNWQNTQSLINYSFPLLRENIPYEDWYIKYSVKWIMTDDTWRATLPPGSKYIMGLKFSYNDGSSTLREFNLKKPTEIVNNTWYHITMLDLIAPYPDTYEYDPPANVSMYFSFGVKDAAYSPIGSLTIYYDNVSFEIQSIPKPSTINLNITDNASGGLKNQPIQDFSNLFGKGQISFEGSWTGEAGGTTHEFSFSSNSTGDVLINSDFFVKASSLSYTTTNIGSTGSEFIVENSTKTIWTMNFPILIPGSYSTDYYVNVSKPLNWNVTHVIDPYTNNRIDEVIGARPGNSTLTIPNNIIIGGLWKIVAEAPNYVNITSLFKKDESIWSKNDTFHVDDELKINATIKAFPDIGSTNGTLKIFSPNGSLWYQEGDVSVDINGNVEFSKITLGTNNASTGKYSAQIIWHDNNLNITQVGFSLLQFNVIHKTNLTAIDSYFNQLSEDPLLLKVKFLDSDFNQSIPSATVTYNSTFGTYGSMIYQGSGIYSIEIDTSSLSFGDYYFSFNASKSFYENQTMENLIHLKIVAQSLDLEVPHYTLEGNANSIISCKINTTLAITGSLIYPVNISTDWFNPYNITDHSNGTYTLDFSTINIPTSGYLESYTVEIFANKTNYGNTNDFITLLIHPISTTVSINSDEITANSLIDSYFQQTINISVRAYAVIDEHFFSGGNITLINGEYEVELYENADYWFNRSILISTSTFSIGPNYVYLRFQQNNYTTTIFTFQILVNQMEINVGTPDFEGFISGAPGETVLIKLNLTETGSANYVENATVFYSWNFGAGYFNDIGSGIYELELPLPTGFGGSYDFELIISKEGILYKTKEFTFFIDINQVEGPNLFIWIIIFALIAISGILGVLSLRSYVILPKRRKREAELISKIQVFKDVWNIRAAILIHKESGVPVYSEEISIMGKDHNSTLISGFIQAITSFSEALVDKEFKSYKKLATDYEYLKTIIDLDFKFFQLLVCDYETIRVLLILRDTASERLKKQLYLLATALNSQFSKEFREFVGRLSHIDKELQGFLFQFLFLHYNREFEITPNKNYYNSILESGELTNLERRIINVISSMTKKNNLFLLKAVINLIEEENEDLVLEALNSLILRKIIISPYFSKSKSKKEANIKNINSKKN